MNPYDELLVWASEVRTGSIESLRSAAAWAVPQQPQHDVVDDLLALGHLEVADGRWRIARTALVALANGGGNSIVVGARPRWLLEVGQALDEASDPALAALADHLLENMFVPQRGPSTWFLSFGPEAPVEVLKQFGVAVLDDLSGALMNKLLTGAPPGERRSVRPGELVSYLSPGNGEVPVWDPARFDADQGAYAYLRNNQRIYALRTEDGWIETDRRWAEWLGVPGVVPKLWSSPREGSMFVRASHRLPTSVERALVLKTGRLPEQDHLPGGGEPVPVLRYSNIPYVMAERIARTLNKELHLA